MNIVFKNYIHLTPKQSETILHLRNLEYIRVNMTNIEMISFQNHLKWVQTLHANASKEYFALIVDDTVVGSCSWVQDEKKVISWGIFFEESVNPLITSLSAFLFMEYLFENKGFETVDSQVRKKNLLAYKFNQNLGFSLYHEDEAFYTLSLSQEQWKQKSNSRFITSLKKYLGKIKYEFQ